MSNLNLSLKINEDSKVIQLLIDGRTPFNVSIVDKNIDIDKLYEWLDIKVENTLSLDPSCPTFVNPTSEYERIYNNIYYFISTLLGSVNSKLQQIRTDQENVSQLNTTVQSH